MLGSRVGRILQQKDETHQYKSVMVGYAPDEIGD